jgi:MSHA biogenesis protein MshK
MNVRRLLLLGAGVLAAATVSSEGTALRDPTRPSGWRAPAAAEQAKQAPVMRLQGTFSVAGSRSALIDGQRVVVGDQVGGAKVLRIEKNKVVLRMEGETVELAALAAPVKTPARQTGDRK